MAQHLGLTIMSFFLTFILLIPFIDWLYKIKLRRAKQITKDMFNMRTPLFDKFNSWKAGTPFGGGILIIAVVTIMTLWAYGLFSISIKFWELFAMLFTFIGFGLLGLYDDLKKLTKGSNKAMFFGLQFRYKFLLQWTLAFIVAAILYYQLGYNFPFIHGFGIASISWLYIPFAAFVIVSFTNAANIADGLDGLASGLFLICLVAFLAIASADLDQQKHLGVFIAILLGSVSAFLYFNIFRARLWLGDVGSLSLGAILAVIGLLTGKIPALAIIGGLFVIEAGSSLIQILGKKFLHRKIFPAAPFHLYLQQRGWEEPKIVMRAWLVGFIFAVVGLYIAFIK